MFLNCIRSTIELHTHRRIKLLISLQFRCFFAFQIPINDLWLVASFDCFCYSNHNITNGNNIIITETEWVSLWTYKIRVKNKIDKTHVTLGSYHYSLWKFIHFGWMKLKCMKIIEIKRKIFNRDSFSYLLVTCNMSLCAQHLAQ